MPPDRNAVYWTTTDVAEYCGVNVGTISSYRSRQQMPAPDDKIGRTWVWRPSTIIRWRMRLLDDEPEGECARALLDLGAWLRTTDEVDRELAQR